MAHTTEILDLLADWKNRQFRDYEISMVEACISLKTKKPLVELRPMRNGSRWLLYKSGTDKLAVLFHVGIWAWSSDLDTGNYVPEEETAPKDLPDSRVQNAISNRCEFSYALDTTTDASIYDNMMLLENHAIGLPGFNKGNRTRRTWQDGKGIDKRQKFIFASSIFARRTPYNSKEGESYKVSYDVHPWISSAVETDQNYIPNPEKPRVLDYTDGVLSKIEFCNQPELKKGDIVWISFKVAFGFTKAGWGPEFVPLEFVRVGRLPENISATMESNAWPTLDSSFSNLPEGWPIKMIEGLKRKEIEWDEDNESLHRDDDAKHQRLNMSDDDHVMVEIPEEEDNIIVRETERVKKRASKLRK